MKKLVALAVSTAMAVTLFAGCGGTKTSGTSSTGTQAGTAAETKSEPVKLVFWGALPPESGPQVTVDGYKKVAPNVTVEYVRYINDDTGNTKLDTALMSGESIDVFTSYSFEKRDKRIMANMAADITDLCKKMDIDLIRDFGEGAKTSIIDGKIYSIPTNSITAFIAVNKDMFDAAGIKVPTDWTIDEMKDIAKKLTKGEGNDKVYGMIGDPYVKAQSFVQVKLGNDKPFLNKDATATTWKSTPEFKKYFTTLFDMMYKDKSYIPYEDLITQKITSTEAMSSVFLNGKSAMMVAGTYALRTLKDTAKFPRNFKIAFAPMPKIDKDQSTYYRSTLYYDDMMINARTKNKEEALKFIKYYYTDGFDGFVQGGRVPLYTKFDSNKSCSLLLKGVENLFDTQSFTQTVLTPAKNTIQSVTHMKSAEFDKIYTEEQEAYLLKDKNVDKLLDNLQKRQDALLNAK